MSGIGKAAGRSEKLGFVGLGLMGAPMTRRLLDAGYRVTVWNRSAEKAAALVEAGATHANRPRDVVPRAGIIFTCLTDAAAVEDVAFGADGLSRAPGAGRVVVDFSSIHPDATRTIARRLKEANGM
jgi:3-hydroxyisobutyrate dehydrogenase